MCSAAAGFGFLGELSSSGTESDVADVSSASWAEETWAWLLKAGADAELEAHSCHLLFYFFVMYSGGRSLGRSYVTTGWATPDETNINPSHTFYKHSFTLLLISTTDLLYETVSQTKMQTWIRNRAWNGFQHPTLEVKGSGCGWGRGGALLLRCRPCLCVDIRLSSGSDAVFIVQLFSAWYTAGPCRTKTGRNRTSQQPVGPSLSSASSTSRRGSNGVTLWLVTLLFRGIFVVSTLLCVCEACFAVIVNILDALCLYCHWRQRAFSVWVWMCIRTTWSVADGSEGSSQPKTEREEGKKGKTGLTCCYQISLRCLIHVIVVNMWQHTDTCAYVLFAVFLLFSSQRNVWYYILHGPSIVVHFKVILMCLYGIKWFNL